MQYVVQVSGEVLDKQNRAYVNLKTKKAISQNFMITTLKFNIG